MRNTLSFAHAGKNIARGAQKIAEGRVLKGAGQIAAGFALSLSAAIMAPITLPLKAAMAARSHLKTAEAKFQSALKQCHGNIDTKLPGPKTMRHSHKVSMAQCLTSSQHFAAPDKNPSLACICIGRYKYLQQGLSVDTIVETKGEQK